MGEEVAIRGLLNISNKINMSYSTILEGKLKRPIFVQLELTERCNHFCKHCYNYWNYGNYEKKDIDLDSLKQVLLKLEENEIFDLTLTGGEPLINNEAIDFILEQREKLFSYDIGINTNLSTLPTDYSKLRGFTILFSYPAYSKETWQKIVGVDDQQKVLNNLEKIISFVPVQANMAISKLNLGELYKTGEFLYKTFGISRFAATPASPVSRVEAHKQIILSSEEVLESLRQLRQLKKDYDIEVDVLESLPLCLMIEDRENYIFLGRSCSAGKTTLTVSSGGDIRPCSRASQKYGNILKEDILLSWNKMSLWKSPDILPLECKECSAMAFCGGGCRVNGEYFQGAINGKDMWAREKIPESKLSEIIEDFHRKRPNIELNKLFRIKEGLRFRKEGEDTYVAYSDGDFLLINKSLSMFLQENRGKLLTSSNRNIDIVNNLYYSKLIQEVKNERKS